MFKNLLIIALTLVDKYCFRQMAIKKSCASTRLMNFKILKGCKRKKKKKTLNLKVILSC
jgi:hypothetical protein